ncbi:hypothetical protein vseg_002359 [Gypsophila vaccaria]
MNLQSTLINNNPSSNISNNNKQVSSKRASGKRDRHTKISTAQGVRDRRVRLSINIAREFFNLQDKLGFDKASKTLGWLLDKSKDAIDELTSTNTSSIANKGLISGFGSNVVARNIEGGEVFEVDENVDSGKNASTRKRRRKQQQLLLLKHDQSVALKTIRRTRRAKARDRARERTKNKKTIINHHQNNNHTYLESLNHHHGLIDQQRLDEQNDLIFRQSISSSSPSNLMACGGANKGVSVRESVVIKSKPRESSLNYSHNDMITKDYEVGCYDNYHNDHNNFFGIIQTPGLSALNIINLSTEIHINGKSWDNYSNQDLH